MSQYIDDDIDDDIDNDTNINTNNDNMNEVEMGKMLSNIDPSIAEKLANFKSFDLKSMQKMFNKMNLDKNKLKSMMDKMNPSNPSDKKDDKPLTRDELRKKLREKTKTLGMSRLSSSQKQNFINNTK